MNEHTLHKDRRISLKEVILNIFKGALVGTGAILPGISGGVLCVAFGIYEPLMQILSDPKRHLKKNLAMFVPFAFGWVFGFTALAGVTERFFAAAPAAAYMLFAGLVAGTVPQMLSDSEQAGKTSYSWLIVSFIAFLAWFEWLSGSASASISPGLFWYFFCGAVWGLSLIIPGLSSSSVLILMGLYQPMTSGIASLDLTVILPLLAGMALTVLTLSKAVASLFEKHRSALLKIISGIMLASALRMVPDMGTSLLMWILPAFCMILGYGTARWMDLAHDAIPEALA